MLLIQRDQSCPQSRVSYEAQDKDRARPQKGPTDHCQSWTWLVNTEPSCGWFTTEDKIQGSPEATVCQGGPLLGQATLHSGRGQKIIFSQGTDRHGLSHRLGLRLFFLSRLGWSRGSPLCQGPASSQNSEGLVCHAPICVQRQFVYTVAGTHGMTTQMSTFFIFLQTRCGSA